MIPKQELDPIELFIEELANRAQYRYAGEKPLAVLAALEAAGDAMRTEHLTLSKALSSNLSGRNIKTTFIRLAYQTGKLKDPDSSWGNVVTSKKELLEILYERRSIDEVFMTASKDRTDKILAKYYAKLGL
jgi:hypothetical protein